MQYYAMKDTDMEFLDIKLTKDSSRLLLAIHSLFYWRILKKTILYSGFKNPWKKNTWVFSWIAFGRMEKLG